MLNKNQISWSDVFFITSLISGLLVFCLHSFPIIQGSTMLVSFIVLLFIFIKLLLLAFFD